MPSGFNITRYYTSYLDTQINKSSKINSTDDVKFLRLLSQGNIEHLEDFQLSLLGNNGIALDFSEFGQVLSSIA
jgi:hypothetical protein